MRYLKRLWAVLRELAHPLTTSVIVEAGGDPPPIPDPMRVISAREVAPNVYEVTTESARYGRVTQRVLVLHERMVEQYRDDDRAIGGVVLPPIGPIDP